MRKFFCSAVLALMMAPAFVGAQDFDAGLAAADAGNYATALREWKPLAEQGIAEAQYNLGIMYDNGYGVTQDHAEAVRWYRMAAEQGNAAAGSVRGRGGLFHRVGGVTGVAIEDVGLWWSLRTSTSNRKAPR